MTAYRDRWGAHCVEVMRAEAMKSDVLGAATLTGSQAMRKAGFHVFDRSEPRVRTCAGGVRFVLWIVYETCSAWQRQVVRNDRRRVKRRESDGL